MDPQSNNESKAKLPGENQTPVRGSHRGQRSTLNGTVSTGLGLKETPQGQQFWF